jgi:hypothetical protein
MNVPWLNVSMIKLVLATLTMRVKIKAQLIHGGEEIE